MQAVNPYLIFGGNCAQAMNFYAKCLNAELFVMPYSDAPGNCAEGQKDKVIHSRLLKKGVPILMASDDHESSPVKPGGNNFWVCVAPESVEETEKMFAALSEKANVSTPLHDSFWGARFGMLTDQFGVNWMFNFEYQKKQ